MGSRVVLSIERTSVSPTGVALRDSVNSPLFMDIEANPEQQIPACLELLCCHQLIQSLFLRLPAYRSKAFPKPPPAQPSAQLKGAKGSAGRAHPRASSGRDGTSRTGDSTRICLPCLDLLRIMSSPGYQQGNRRPFYPFAPDSGECCLHNAMFTTPSQSWAF